MVQSTHQGTRNIPLKLAEAITAVVNAEWESGGFLEKVTPITKDLLRFWYPEGSFSGQLKSVCIPAINNELTSKNIKDNYY